MSQISSLVEVPPRRRVIQEAIVAPVLLDDAHGVPPSRLSEILQAWRSWSWESKAVSSTLVGLIFLIIAVLLQPSDGMMVKRALSSRTQFSMPSIIPFVERREMMLIVDAIEHGKLYIIVDGGNRVGKSISVEVAVSRLSSFHTVRWSVCDEGDTAANVLQRLFGLDTEAKSLSRIISSVAKLSPNIRTSVADIRRLVLSTRASGSEPVFVVEMAERLEVKELKSLLDFAKELVDKRLGRFIFVFSPTEKLDIIGDFGSVSRAKVIHVGDLNNTETTEFLRMSKCAEDRISPLYSLVGGHLPHLITDTVQEYCRGNMSLAEVQVVLFSDIDAQFKAVDRVLGIGTACEGLCGVLHENWPKPEVINTLLMKHLVVAALKKGVYLDSKLVRLYVNTRCTCVK